MANLAPRPVRGRTDLFAEWFSALEAEGESMRFRLGRCDDQRSHPTWHFLPHQDYDGIGGLAVVLRQLEGKSLDMPRLAEPYPSRARRWLAAARFALRRSHEAIPFRDFDDAWTGDPRQPTAPSAYAWALLSESDTHELRQAARSRGVSLNAWMLWSLTRAMLPHLQRDRGSVAWIVPVNMRGLRPELRDTANQAATFDVAFPAGANVAQVDEALKREREALAHFGVWQLLQLLEHLDPESIRRLAQRESRIKKHGSFSNLGSLRVSGSEFSPQSREFWMAFNPVIKSRPVGAACLTYEGRLALTLQLHPALSRDESTAHAWLLAWLQALFGSAE
ncbi:MAG TPA: hypothetical protein VFQ35_22425 [Polyangiaceae bacterium]|nr:hypothetical protein [Polyangiaceae bacterium]